MGVFKTAQIARKYGNFVDAKVFLNLKIINPLIFEHNLVIHLHYIENVIERNTDYTNP